MIVPVIGRQETGYVGSAYPDCHRLLAPSTHPRHPIRVNISAELHRQAYRSDFYYPKMALGLFCVVATTPSISIAVPDDFPSRVARNSNYRTSWL